MTKIKQPTIADILHYAADKCLLSRSPIFGKDLDKEKFSCCAVSEAIFRLTGCAYTGEFLLLKHRVMTGLEAMGCDQESTSMFTKHGDTASYVWVNSKVQGMRYMWLKWAALMAEEQGV